MPRPDAWVGRSVFDFCATAPYLCFKVMPKE